MVANADWITELDDCDAECATEISECVLKSALRWIHSQRMARKNSRGYWQSGTPATKPQPFVALTARVRRFRRGEASARIGRIDWTDTIDSTSTYGEVTSDDALVAYMCRHMLSSSRSGWLLIVDGYDRRVLDILLASAGPLLVDAGYSLRPFISNSRISGIEIRKGRSKWTIVYDRTVTGVATSTLRGIVPDAGIQLPEQWSKKNDARLLYCALSVYQNFLLEKFGVALSRTAGTIAVKCASRFLQKSFRKFSPDPLLTAMERAGHGFRGGIAFGARFRGETWRIDVNRQYTHALRFRLPSRAAFGRWSDDDPPDHGVYLCNLFSRRKLLYPVPVWTGDGFDVEYGVSGHVVSVLHVEEFEAIQRLGATIRPWYGFRFTETFTLENFVEYLQDLLDQYGRDSAHGKVLKPIGNYVYGKLAQNPIQRDILYSNDEPPDAYFPYYDDTGRHWPGIWERDTISYSPYLHVDIAATITAYARTQTVLMWQLLESLGLNVVRVHTDSITTAQDPADYVDIDENRIGAWKFENRSGESIILGANCYVDDTGAHIAGVSEPTWEMIARAYDGHVSYAINNQRTPLRGFRSGVRRVRRRVS